MFDFQRYFAAGSQALGTGICWPPSKLQHYDGPFINPDDARKENLVLRYSDGDENERLFGYRHVLSPALEQYD